MINEQDREIDEACTSHYKTCRSGSFDRDVMR